MERLGCVYACCIAVHSAIRGFVLCFHCAGRAKDLGALIVAIDGTTAVVDHTQRAVGEAQRNDGRVQIACITNRIEVVVNMQLWDPDEDYTRISMVDDTFPILGVELPLVKVPITPGKNITVICEVIAMNHLLRHYGYDPAEVFAKRLADRIRKNESTMPLRGIEYFEHDYE